MAIEFVIHFIGIPCAATKPDGHIQATNSERSERSPRLVFGGLAPQSSATRPRLDFPGLALNPGLPGLWWTVDGLRTITWGHRPQHQEFTFGKNWS